MKNNLTFLNSIYEIILMGILSNRLLLKNLKNRENKIIDEIETMLKRFEEYQVSIENLYNNSDEFKKIGLVNKASTSISVKKNVRKDNSDVYIADLLIKELTMGEISINKRIDEDKDFISESTLELAEEIKKFMQTEIKILKKYL